MIKPGQNCRIVDHPDGVFDPKAVGFLNVLVRADNVAQLPDCHLACALQFVIFQRTDGPLWEVTLLQSSRGLPAGTDGIMVPEKNLQPLPDLSDEDKLIETKELEHA